jgi:hypothetical protein
MVDHTLRAAHRLLRRRLHTVVLFSPRQAGATDAKCDDEWRRTTNQKCVGRTGRFCAGIEKTISIVPLSTFLYICSESLPMPDGKFRERLRHVCGYSNTHKLTRVSKKDMPTSRRYPIPNSFLVIASRGFVCVCGLVAIVVRPVSHTPV